MRFRMLSVLLAGVLSSISLVPASADQVAEPTEAGFHQWKQQYRERALEAGISEELVDKAVEELQFIPRTIELDRRQPEFVLTHEQYLTRVLSEWKINKAREEYDANKPLLDEIGKAYGVQPRFIVALWGNETNFGRVTGSFSVPGALATLAYEGRRASLFESELTNALKIIDAGHIDFDQMEGSWAGAMGQCQFMPSSFLNFAEDYDKDGKADIWTNKKDVFASIANYLSRSGWNDKYTWGRQVKLPNNFDFSLVGRSNQKPLSEWQKLGVRRYEGGDLPDVDINAAVIAPGGKDGRIYLVYQNYQTLMKWNRSDYFGTAVGLLADRIIFR